MKLSPNPDLPAIQPLIQRYCLRGSIETNFVQEENDNEGKSFPENINITNGNPKEKERKNLKENYQSIDSSSSNGPQARKLDTKEFDLNQVPEHYQKELEYEQEIDIKPSNRDDPLDAKNNELNTETNYFTKESDSVDVRPKLE